VTDIAREPVETASGAQRPRFGRASDNPLVRAVGRIPLPLGAKLLLGFGVVGALLAAGYLLGFVALGQSNSRSEQLRKLQQQAVYEQLLLTDANQLKRTLDYRTRFVQTKDAAFAFDEISHSQWTQLCRDAGLSYNSPTRCSAFGTPPESLPVKLSTIDPALFHLLNQEPFYFTSEGAAASTYAERADTWTSSVATQLGALVEKTRARANALVAADHSSFADSRDLLLGVGAGSLLLALLLGLLLAWSVVAPLRRTESRLDEIAVGDFAGRLEVPNRDEIGALAAKVNRMSDELQGVYRELELASQHKSDFLATMSHELRTPLNAIIGFSEVLQEQMFGELNERQLAYVDDVLAAGKHLLSLINDVLDLAKIEAGRMELDLSEVAVPEILRSAVSLHSERARLEGVELSLTTEPEEITVTADERRVRQVVFNLVSNAVKFTPAHGRIDISARTEDGHVEVAIADTGPGIAAKDRETIFEEFEQTAEGRKAEGTGLGLPLSRKLVELHGGRLWVESEVGRGSTFRFTFPVHHEAEA
jgi:signal transduction histidine kinase